MKRFFKSFVSVFLAVFMAASLISIPSSAAPSLNKTSITVTKGYQSSLSVSGTSKSVTWSTGDKSVATVSSKGKVVGKGVGSTYQMGRRQDQDQDHRKGSRYSQNQGIPQKLQIFRL